MGCGSIEVSDAKSQTVGQGRIDGRLTTNKPVNRHAVYMSIVIFTLLIPLSIMCIIGYTSDYWNTKQNIQLIDYDKDEE